MRPVSNFTLSLQHITDNAIVFHKMLEDIQPKIDTYIFKLINHINESIKIQSNLRRNAKIFMKLKDYYNTVLNDTTEIYETLEQMALLIKETILSFKYIPSRHSLMILNNYDYIYENLNISTMYDKWIRIICKNSLQLPSIYKIIKSYNKDLSYFLSLNKKTFNSKYKEFDFHNTKYELKKIYVLQLYSQHLFAVSDFCKKFAVISSALYKDIKNNTNNHNIRNYIRITSILTTIKTRLDESSDYKLLEDEIKNNNIILVNFWNDYLIYIKEQHNLQIIINKYGAYENKALIFTLVSHEIIIQSINNILLKMKIPLQKSSELTYRYNKKTRPYIKIVKNYENFVKIILS